MHVLAQEGQFEHGEEAGGELVVAGGDGAAAFEPTDGALDGVASPVGIRVDGQMRPALGPERCGMAARMPRRRR
jgi:hypothetical protein